MLIEIVRCLGVDKFGAKVVSSFERKVVLSGLGWAGLSQLAMWVGQHGPHTGSHRSRMSFHDLGLPDGVRETREVAEKWGSGPGGEGHPGPVLHDRLTHES